MTRKKLTRAQQIRRRQIAENIIDWAIALFWGTLGAAILIACIMGAAIQEQDKLNEELTQMIADGR